MGELLRTAGEVKLALTVAVGAITLGSSVTADKVERLIDRRERCRALPDGDPAFADLLGAVDRFLALCDGLAIPPNDRRRDPQRHTVPAAADIGAMREALLVYFRIAFPGDGPPARQCDTAQRQHEADLAAFAKGDKDDR